MSATVVCSVRESVGRLGVRQRQAAERRDQRAALGLGQQHGRRVAAAAEVDRQADDRVRVAAVLDRRHLDDPLAADDPASLYLSHANYPSRYLLGHTTSTT